MVNVFDTVEHSKIIRLALDIQFNEVFENQFSMKVKKIYDINVCGIYIR